MFTIDFDSIITRLTFAWLISDGESCRIGHGPPANKSHARKPAFASFHSETRWFSISLYDARAGCQKLLFAPPSVVSVSINN